MQTDQSADGGSLRRGIPASDSAPSADRTARACTNCVHAKAKCLPSPNPGQPCDRCGRLRKQCQPSPPMRRRRAQNTQRTRAKIEKLEETVDGLVSLMKSGQDSITSDGTANASSTTDDPPRPAPVPASTDRGSAVDTQVIAQCPGNALKAHATLPCPAAVLPVSPAASNSSDLVSTDHSSVPSDPRLEPTAEDAERHLSFFRTQYIPQLPFLCIPPSQTARQLRQDRPLLWLSIMTVANRNSAQQMLLSREMRVIFGREAYVSGTRNLDLLLAVMCYVAWDRWYFLDKALTVSLVQLALAIMYDLGLDTAPTNDSSLGLEYEWKGAQNPTTLWRSPTLEERRALMGCFLLSDMPAVAPKGQPLHWTSYCQESLQILEKESNAATDVALVQLVRLRLISSAARDVISNHGQFESKSPYVPSAIAQLRSLQSQAHHFHSSIALEGLQKDIVSLELHNAEMSIFEAGFSTADIFSPESNGRFESNFACLGAAKQWVDIFFRIAPRHYAGFSIFTYATMSRLLVDLWRLSTYDHPSWDRGLVRSTVDVASLLQQTGERFSLARAEVGMDANADDPGQQPHPDIFSHMARKIAAISAWWQEKMNTVTSPPDRFDALPDPSSLDFLGDLPLDLFETWAW